MTRYSADTFVCFWLKKSRNNPKKSLGHSQATAIASYEKLMATICGTLENKNITAGCHMANVKIVFWSVFVLVFLCRLNKCLNMSPPSFYLLRSLSRDGLTVTLQRPENCPISNFISRMSVFHWKLSFQHSPTILKTFNWSFDQEDELR